MNKPEFLKHLRGLVAEGRTEDALDFLHNQINDLALYFSNDVVMLKSQFVSAKKQFILSGVIENSEFGLISARVNFAILEIADKIEKNSNILEIKRRGHLLHKIPSKMVKEVETKCIIRIAYFLEHLVIGFTLDIDTAIQVIQVTGLMSVELIDDNQIKTFEIRTSTDEEQFVINEECTEWIFKVLPLRVGEFPLVLKIVAIELINGKERKRNIIIEKQIQVSIEKQNEKILKFALINFEDDIEIERFLAELEILRHSELSEYKNRIDFKKTEEQRRLEKEQKENKRLEEETLLLTEEKLMRIRRDRTENNNTPNPKYHPAIDVLPRSIYSSRRSWIIVVVILFAIIILCLIKTFVYP